MDKEQKRMGRGMILPVKGMVSKQVSVSKHAASILASGQKWTRVAQTHIDYGVECKGIKLGKRVNGVLGVIPADERIDDLISAVWE